MHSRCLVILRPGEDLESSLASFDVQTENPRYLEFQDYHEDFMQFYESQSSKDTTSNKSIEDFAKDLGYVCQDGRWGYMMNPNGFWDWWEVGGRWENFLQRKDPPGGACNECSREEFDYEGQRKGKEALFYAVFKNGSCYTEDDFDNWAEEEATLVNSVDPKDRLVIIDCHM